MERELSRRLEVARVIPYVNDREKGEGGFSLVSELYPDIEDTYCAVRTLQLLHHEVDRSKTGSYLKSIELIVI